MTQDEKYEADMRAESKQTLEKVNTLNQLLLEAGRLDDLQRSFSNSEFQEELFKEFGL